MQPEGSLSLGAPGPDEMSLLELADRLLNRGVVLTGEATISVAGVDLIYLGLNVVLRLWRTSKRRMRLLLHAVTTADGAEASPTGLRDQPYVRVAMKGLAAWATQFS